MFSNILVAVNGSEPAFRAFDTALQLACETGAELHPLYVVALPGSAADVSDFASSIMWQALEQQGESVMKHCVGTMARRGARGAPEFDDLARPGDDVAERIVSTAERLHADLIVLGTHGRPRADDAHVGSTAERVLRSARCPVLMVSERSSLDEDHEQDERRSAEPNIE